MNILENIKMAYKRGDALIRLIFINVAVFLVVQALLLFSALMKSDFGLIVSSYLAAPADFTELLYRPWTVITYMFMHEGIMHILFNMIALYWFGKIFMMYFSEKQLVGLYFTGGLAGVISFIVAYNVFPFFENVLQVASLVGASASIMAIIVATAVQTPDMELRLLFIGNIKLKYIAVISVLISFFGIASNNAGGEIAHLGGALAGYIFVVSLRKGNDITKWLNGIFDFIVDLFKPRKSKVKRNKKSTGQKMTDAEFNMDKASRMKEIDRILDKIKTSGYESLSAEEKKRLFDQGKN
ncbi:MAG: rhomboid family intramembrane serine protease [Paludibacter sp.]|nr:rhomboid family intramembrane serine protease [Paludibacter sp.]